MSGAQRKECDEGMDEHGDQRVDHKAGEELLKDLATYARKANHTHTHTYIYRKIYK
jgi:hypothetical protein